MASRIRVPAAIVAVLGAMVVPSIARAVTYCVAASGGCDQTMSSVQGALSAAQSSAADDVVRIGPGVFVGPFSYSGGPASGRLEIDGAGTAETHLTSPGTQSSEVVLTATRSGGGSAPVLRHFEVSVPSSATTYTFGMIFDGLADDVRVTAPVSGSNGYGPVAARAEAGAVLEHSEISMPATSTGIYTFGPTQIDDSEIAATFAVLAQPDTTPGGLSIERSRITSSGGLAVESCTTVRIEDSLLRLTGAGTLLDAIGGAVCTSGPSEIDATHVTAVGSGNPNSTGAFADADYADATIDLRYSIIRDVGRSFYLRTVDTSTPDTALVRSRASDWERSKITIYDGPGTETVEEPVPNIDADPLFVDSTGGDFHLKAGSPAIDVSTDSLGAGESTTDLDGNARILDGNGDGVAARDMGAFEFVPDTTAPMISHASVDPSVFAVNRKGAAETQSLRRRAKRGTTFKYSVSEASRVVFTIKRASQGRKVGKKCQRKSRGNRRHRRCTRYTKVGSFAVPSVAGANAHKFSGRIGSRALKPSKYRVSLVATDAAGNASSPRMLSFRVVRH